MSSWAVGNSLELLSGGKRGTGPLCDMNRAGLAPRRPLQEWGVELPSIPHGENRDHAGSHPAGQARPPGVPWLLHKAPQTGVQTTDTLLRCWRLDAQNEGVGRAGSFWFHLQVAVCTLWCSLACRCILPISAPIFTWPSPLGLCVFSPSSISLLRTLIIEFKAHPESRMVFPRDT